MNKVLLFIVLFCLLIFAIFAYNVSNNVTVSASPADANTTSLQPAHLRIAALHVDAPVINVGTTADGKMDAPVSKAINSPYWTSVFWYAPGAVPGQAGNAVIAGHVDREGGNPAVFWSLKSLKQGDTIVVTRQDQQELHFVVERVVSYPANTVSKGVLNAIFGPATGHHLNLITCSGAWTGTGYDQRLVVFTTQVNA